MHVNNQKAFIEYSNCMDDIYKNIKQYILNKQRKMLIVLDEMMASKYQTKFYTLFDIETSKQTNDSANCI